MTCTETSDSIVLPDSPSWLAIACTRLMRALTGSTRHTLTGPAGVARADGTPMRKITANAKLNFKIRCVTSSLEECKGPFGVYTSNLPCTPFDLGGMKVYQRLLKRAKQDHSINSRPFVCPFSRVTFGRRKAKVHKLLATSF